MMNVVARQSGFSLIELLVVVIIIGILASIAYPSYVENVRNTRRADAQAAMMNAISLAEAYRAQRFSYAGYTLPGNMSSADFYNYGVSITNNNQSLVVTAAPKGGQAGAGAMAVNNQGVTCLNKGNDSSCTLGTDAQW